MNADEALREMRYEIGTHHFAHIEDALLREWADAIEAELAALRERVGKVAEDCERAGEKSVDRCPICGDGVVGGSMILTVRHIAARLREAVK